MPPTGRALLRQPFFPLYSSSPPTQLPPLPSPPSSFPKYPSSSSSISNSLPFFPLYPSPPPPRPSPSIPTFPANISTLITPSHYAPPSSSKLILIISLPILALLLLALSAAAAFFLVRRYRSSVSDLDDPGSDNHRLVPPNSTASGEVNPCLAADSPELRPLPPLSRQARRSSSSEEDAFYSPPPSSPPARLNPPPPPPPPPPRAPAGLQPPVLAPPKVRQDSEQEGEKRRRPRLKALHWDKVRARSDRTMVWDHLKSSSFQLNEEMIETLFGCDGTNGGKKETTDVKRKVDMASTMNENMVLNLKKAQNIAILLRALNVTTEEVCEALLEGEIFI